MDIEQLNKLLSLHKQASFKLEYLLKELAVAPEGQSEYALTKLSEQYNDILLTITASGNLTV